MMKQSAIYLSAFYQFGQWLCILEVIPKHWVFTRKSKAPGSYPTNVIGSFHGDKVARTCS